RKIALRKKIYPLAMVIYGVARFFLDFFRDTEASFLLGLSKGSFWSLCSFIIGVIALVIINNKEKKQQST
ncbi:MAG: prolipoprotein diacylglyceryl transferase, partial [Oscillospiraceae bacterium]|nr:prolipoprotein diacylglyceryl transferase [Oscillospiraceae bacterium]